MKQHAARKQINLFSLDFEIFKNQEPATPASFRTWLDDVFPFFKIKSLTSLILLSNILVFFISIFLHPWFILNQDQFIVTKIIHITVSPWSFNQGIVYFLAFQCFLLNICAYLQKKLGWQDFFAFYYFSCVLGYVMMQMLLPSYPLCSNVGVLSLYGLSLMVEQQFGEQITATKKIHQIYKFILFSFSCYAGIYNTRYTHPFLYFGGCISIPILIFCKKQLRKQYLG